MNFAEILHGRGFEGQTEATFPKVIIFKSLLDGIDAFRTFGVTACCVIFETRIMDQARLHVLWRSSFRPVGPPAAAVLNVRRQRKSLSRVHFHDGTLDQIRLEMKPVGEGVYDLSSVVRLLMGMGYPGFLSGEWFGWEDYESYLPKEVEGIRLLENRCPV